MTVRISRSLLDSLIADAAASEEEICGLLFGSAAHISSTQACANVATDRVRKFEIDPDALFAAHRAARGGGPALVGHYHSHPSGPAQPSLRDRAAAAGDGALWLILGKDGARVWRSDRVRAFHEVPVAVA